MRRVIPLALIALSTACAVGPGYRRPALALPDGWRPASASADSLRPFFDWLRTSRDTLLPPGADTARVPVGYDTSMARRGVDSAAALQWLDLIQDSVLRQLVDTSLRANRDVRTAVAVIDEFRAQYRAARGALVPELTAHGQAGRNQAVFGTFGAQTFDVYRATADLSWELDLWGRLRRGNQAARADVFAREEDRRALQPSFIADVATATFDLRAPDLNPPRRRSAPPRPGSARPRPLGFRPSRSPVSTVARAQSSRSGSRPGPTSGRRSPGSRSRCSPRAAREEANRSTSPGPERRRRGPATNRRCSWRCGKWRTRSWDCARPRIGVRRRSARGSRCTA